MKSSRKSKTKDNTILILSIILGLVIIGVVVGVVVYIRKDKNKNGKTDINKLLNSFDGAKNYIGFNFLLKNTTMGKYIEVFKTVNYEAYTTLRTYFIANNDTELNLVKAILLNTYKSNLNKEFRYFTSYPKRERKITYKQMINRITK